MGRPSVGDVRSWFDPLLRSHGMDLMWGAVVVDSNDPVALGRWWAAALGWDVDADDSFGVEVRPRGDGGRYPTLVFVPGSAKTSKNRLHLDFHAADQHAEVKRLLALGARRVDIGQGNVPWVVLSDPEGNEFCVLEPRG
jgi:predicted enzyme related to lactoylglutathione lyase